jgi:hypothetical protein
MSVEPYYHPKKYMTVEVLSELLKEYEWPAPYTLEGDLPYGIVMRFPFGHLYFSEGFESDMTLEFLTEATKTDYSLALGHALSILVPDSQRDGNKQPIIPGLIDDESPDASLEKVQNGIKDLCVIALRHLRPCILGDFSWVEKYLATLQQKRP